MERKKIMLVCEGSYPVSGGGLSTWAHMLCSSLKEYDFIIYSISADYAHHTKFELTPNTTEFKQVPIWDVGEPEEAIDYTSSSFELLTKKYNTDDHYVSEKFIKSFSDFLDFVYDNNDDIEKFGETVFDLWQYFRISDYKSTFQSVLTWETFKQKTISARQLYEHGEASLHDFTAGLQCIYRLLLPLSVDVPRADLSHITVSGFTIIPALILKYQYGTPILCTEHGVYIRERMFDLSGSKFSWFFKNILIRLTASFSKLAYYNVDHLLSVSNYNLEWVNKFRLKTKKLEVIFNGIDTEFFRPLGKPEAIRHIPTVVALAKVYELKDIITMIRACAVVAKEIPEVRFVVYGNHRAVPEYTEKCLLEIEKLGVQDHFRFAGFHDKPNEVYCEGDISILTSVSEGLPYTILESMSCGVPVVATDVGGVREIVDEDCGIVCMPRDYQSIGEAVIRLLNDPNERKRLSLNGRKKIQNIFALEKCINNYRKVYQSMLN